MRSITAEPSSTQAAAVQSRSGNPLAAVLPFRTAVPFLPVPGQRFVGEPLPDNLTKGSFEAREVSRIFSGFIRSVVSLPFRRIWPISELSRRRETCGLSRRGDFHSAQLGALQRGSQKPGLPRLIDEPVDHGETG